MHALISGVCEHDTVTCSVLYAELASCWWYGVNSIMCSFDEPIMVMPATPAFQAFSLFSVQQWEWPGVRG